MSDVMWHNNLITEYGVLLFQFGTAGNSNSFKAFKVVPNSAYFDPSTHFQHDASKDKIKSDLIVETCEDMEHVATATLKPVSNSGKTEAIFHRPFAFSQRALTLQLLRCMIM